MCRVYIALFLCFLSFPSFASSEGVDLVCQEVVSGDKDFVFLAGNDLKFKIKSPRRGCDSIFTYELVERPGKRWMITSWPTDDELGLNAQRDLFIASSGASEAVYVGSIPVDATAVSVNTYRSVSQLGGSIYEAVYVVGDVSIEIESPSRELIVSDTVCVYRERSDDVCQLLEGTFDAPLCVYNHNEKKFLKDLSSCSGLTHSD